jgi:undecaprenyl-diphosphatase
MDIIQAIIMGMVQGLTEFLPVSSSAHLVIAPELLGTQSSLAFDTLLHVGTLVAVIGYFWKDITSMIKSFVSSLLDIPQGKFKEGVADDPYKRLAWLVMVGTIPAGLMGVLFKSKFEALFNSVTIVGFFLLVTGVILWGSEWIAKRNIDKKGKDVKEVSFTNSMVIGVFQDWALPGISEPDSPSAVILRAERKTTATFSFTIHTMPIGSSLIRQDIVSFDANTKF